MSEKQDHPTILSVLEIGSSQLSLTSAFCFKNQFEDAHAATSRFQIIFHGSISTTCVIGGFPVDLKQFKEKIEQLKDDCERIIEREVFEVFVVFSSTLIKYHHLLETTALKNNLVGTFEIEKLISQTKLAKNFLGNVPIYFSPFSFSIDNQTKIDNPIGLKGKQLQVTALAMSLPEFNLSNLLSAINNVGFKVTSLCCKGFAAAKGSTSADERALGICVIQMGSKHTATYCFLNKESVFEKTFPFGGNQITQDLFVGLRSTMSKAELVKKDYGKLYYAQNELSQTIEIESIEGQFTKLITKSQIQNIIKPRYEEMLGIVFSRMNEQKLISKLNCGFVLTGGGAHLMGASNHCELVSGKKCRLGAPSNFSGAKEGLTSAKSACIIGGLELAAEISDPANISNSRQKDSSLGTRIFSRVSRTLDSFLS